MIQKADRLAMLLKQSKGENVKDPFVIAPTPDLSTLATSGAASVDLRLGTWFVSLSQARMPYLHFDDDKVANPTKTRYVPFGDEYILHPRAFVLGVTLEWIRLPANLAAYVVGKSSWGRCGLIIATATGVHPGFKGCLTLELSNVGEIPIAVKPGMPICQLFIHAVESEHADSIDHSDFVGSRRPLFRRFGLDDFAKRLANKQPLGTP